MSTSSVIRTRLETGFDLGNFSNPTALQLNGQAAVVNTVLRLTPAQRSQAGSVFHTTAFDIDADTSFQTQFRFRLHGGYGSGGADGFAFVLQNSAAGANALGQDAGYIGYEGVSNSLGIKFDTYRNDGDISGNFVSIINNGNALTNLASGNVAPDLNGGQSLNAWIDYDGDTDQLKVFVSPSTTKPTTPSLAYTVDLSTVLGPKAYFGFSGGTGYLHNNQDIETWKLAVSNYEAPAPTPTPPDAIAPTASFEGITATTPGTDLDFMVLYSDDVALNATTLDTGDVIVTGPNGFSQVASLVLATPTADGTQIAATYRITAPGSTWDVTDNGTYTIELISNQVTDTAGNSAIAGILGTFGMNLTGLDTTAPTAMLDPLPNVSIGSSSVDFAVTYSDDTALNAVTLDGDDLVVVSPNGSSQTASLISTVANGSSITATYRLVAPGGSWDAADNGAYTLNLSPDQVTDTAGNTTAAGTLGTLQVELPPDQLLSPVQLNYIDFSNSGDFKFNGNATKVNNALRLTSAVRNQAGSVFYATPFDVNADTSFQAQFRFRAHGGNGTGGADGFAFVLQNSAAGSAALGQNAGYIGYEGVGNSLAVKFDTYKNDGEISGNFVSVLTNGSAFNNLASGNVAADLNGGQSLYAWIDYDGATNALKVFVSNTTTKPANASVSYTVDLASTVGGKAYLGFSGGTGYLTNNQDIENLKFSITQQTPTLDTTAPTAVLNSLPSVTSGNSTYDFTVIYGDNQAINRSTLDSNDILVTGPNGFSQTATLVSASSQTNGSPITATYRITAPGGTWDGVDNGAYTIALKPNQITDTAGNGVAAGTLGTLQVNIPPAPAPTPTTNSTVEFVNFSNTDGFQLNGNAAATSNILRLTSSARFQAGSAFYKTPFDLTADTSFQAQFRFRAHGGNGTGGADGFAFVLQNSAAGSAALGQNAGFIGYEGIANSLAVKFDTYKNDGEVSGNFVSVLTNGSAFNNLASGNVAADLNSGQSLYAWVDYDGATNLLKVFVSNTTTKPANASVSYTVDLASTVGSKAYLGFSGGTGYLTNNQDIENLKFSITHQTATPDITAPTATLNGLAAVTNGGTTYDFTVTYGDNQAVNRSTLDSNDILVTGPNGFSQTATLVNTSTQTNGSPITATYRITAPGGSWDAADNGSYAIALKSNQVSDTAGNLVAAKALGTVQVSLSSTPLPSPTPTQTTSTGTQFTGTSAANTLNGDGGGNLIRGLAGNDTLKGFGGNDTLNGGTGNDILDGGDGLDAATYADAASGIMADMATGTVNRIAKLMPLGDSITHGAYFPVGVSGYRPVLWQKFQQDKTTIDFVGTNADGPDSLGDKDHEGHDGWRIDTFNGYINSYLNTQKPDVVMLMAGANDTGTADTPSQMIAELSGLIDKITAYSPDVQVLVASIPPVRQIMSDSAIRAQKAAQYNQQIPTLVNNKKAAGKKVSFVDMSSLTVDDISTYVEDFGLHPNDQGYSKMGNIWYNALNTIGKSQNTYDVDKDTLINVENLIGSTFKDVIRSGIGVNVFTGNGGADEFMYSAVNRGSDVITDFGADDLLSISASGFGGGLVAGVALKTVASATGVLVNGLNPISNNATFLYSDRTLWFDGDGLGAATKTAIATLTNGPASLNINQIRIIA